MDTGAATGGRHTRLLGHRVDGRFHFCVHQERAAEPAQLHHRGLQVFFLHAGKFFDARVTHEGFEPARAFPHQALELTGVAGHHAAPEAHVDEALARRFLALLAQRFGGGGGRNGVDIVGNLVQMAFFLTPVLWDLKAAPAVGGLTREESQQMLLHFNPMASVISAWRDIFYEQRIPNWQPLLSVAAISLVLMWISTAVFERRREEFAELV